MDMSISVFEKYCKSEATKTHYNYWFSNFMNWCKENVEPMITDDGLLILKESALQIMVEDYVMSIRKRLSPNSLQLPIASLQLFFSMNDKVLNWKRIKKMIPAQVKKAGYSAYPTGDVKRMLEGTISKRNKALIHFLASTGVRIGGLPDLKIKHVSNMADNCKAVILYENSTEEYFGFLTPESSKALDDYLEERRNDGEHLDENSPLFRADYQVGIQKVTPLTLRGVKAIMERMSKNTDSRKKISKTRFNVMTAHGLRKRYATIIKMDNKISWAVSERLLGHSAYLDENYFRPTMDNLFLEFKKVMPDLTIDDSERERLRRIEAEQKVQDLKDEKDKRIAELEAKIDNLFDMITKKD